MQSLSDSFLSGLNVLFWGITIASIVLTFIAQFSAFFVRQETGRRTELRFVGAEKEIATAQAKAAEANEKAEEAQVKQAELEQQNIVLRTDLVRMQTEATNAKRMLLEVQAETKSTRQDVGAIQSHMQPRIFTQDQRDSIVRLLRTFPPLEAQVMFSAQTSEASEFCQQLRDVLAMAGWSVPDKTIDNIGITCSVDVRFEVRDKGQVPQSILALAKALTDMGFTVAGQEEPGLPGNQVVLRIGDRTTVSP